MTDASPSSDDTFGNQWLQNIPEEDREVVGKYISDWDKGVTQQFQKIHEEYQPYKALGVDPDTLSRAIQLYTYVDQSPQEFYTYLGEALKEMNGTNETPQNAPVGSPSSGQTPVSLEDYGLPPEFVQQFQEQHQQLAAISEFVANEQRTRKQAEEDKVLNDYLETLHKDHGEFDEDYVLAKMYRGMKAEDAIEAFNSLTQNKVNNAVSKQASVPPFLSSGSVPASTVDPAKMSRQEAKNAFAAILAAGQQNNQG